MSAISKWLLSILATVVIGTLIDLIFSGSRMSKTIKCVTATVCLLIIVMPLPSLIGNGFDFSRIELEYNPTLDENYLAAVQKSKVEVLEKATEEELSAHGISDADVKITLTGGVDDGEIVNVKIILSGSGIPDDEEHINKNELAVKLVCEYLKVEEAIVTVHG